MVVWSCYFGPVERKNVMVGAHDGTTCLPQGSQDAKERGIRGAKVPL
jgi:hypothetical protein